MSAPSIVPLGIDISKASFDVLLLRSGKRNQRARFNNTPAEFEQFQQWLQTQGVEQVHACLEATNIYGHALASYLHQQGHIVSIVNPARIKGYAQSQLSRTKWQPRGGSRLENVHHSPESPSFLAIDR
jgi:transposase